MGSILDKCAEETGPKHIKIYAEWDQELKHRFVFFKQLLSNRRHMRDSQWVVLYVGIFGCIHTYTDEIFHSFSFRFVLMVILSRNALHDR